MYIIDGDTKIIEFTTTGSVNIQNVYSSWKSWVTSSDNSKFEEAFRTTGGDPIGNNRYISAYYFLNNSAGWRFKPYSTNHTLLIDGNLYPEDASLPLFSPPSGSHTVTIIIERSSAALTVDSASSLSEATVQSALTAQGYTTSRASNLDYLNTHISSGSLTPSQANMLLELYQLMGLDPSKPLIVSLTERTAGASIHQTIETNNATKTTTVTRT